MPVELMLLLILIGAGTGTMSATINVSPTLVAIPALYFFLPVFDVSFNDFVLVTVATCLTAFIPTHLYAWIKSMKKGVVDFQFLINLAPGVVMGAVIGAQTLSLIMPYVFKITFSVIAFFAILSFFYDMKIDSANSRNLPKSRYLPIGLLLGAVSIVSGESGRILSGYLYKVCKLGGITQRQGTIDGVAVFASIAAMVGFIYPAWAFTSTNLLFMAGAIHLPSVLVLSASHFFFYWLSQNRGTALDKKVLSVSFIIFLSFSLIRLWT